ncbi:hypothetical protein EAF00_003140 [Botryotinia globosa]|nr:hypothetical protein EAF00_003140 [Botryotinia globosa]
MNLAIKTDGLMKVAAAFGKIKRNEKEENYFVWRSQQHITNGPSLKRPGKVFDRKETGRLRPRKGLEYTAKSDQYLEFPIETSLEVKCTECGLKNIDSAPAFWKTDSRFYVIRRKDWCKGCAKSGEINDVPTDPTIPWMNLFTKMKITIEIGNLKKNLSAMIDTASI